MISLLLIGFLEGLFDFLAYLGLVLQLFDHVLVNFLVVVRQVFHCELFPDMAKAQVMRLGWDRPCADLSL